MASVSIKAFVINEFREEYPWQHQNFGGTLHCDACRYVVGAPDGFQDVAKFLLCLNENLETAVTPASKAINCISGPWGK